MAPATLGGTGTTDAALSTVVPIAIIKKKSVGVVQTEQIQAQAAQVQPSTTVFGSASQIPAATQNAMAMDFMTRGHFGAKQTKRRNLSRKPKGDAGFKELLENIQERKTKKLFPKIGDILRK